MKKIIIFVIKKYQKYLSPDQGILSYFIKTPTCGFYPTCSEYCVQAVEKHGSFSGTILSIKRIIRCHPGAEPKIDLVP